nr:HNH endonuclease [Actinomycetes bacterium]
CQACNYTKEAPGWTTTTTEHHGQHLAEFTTPTTATYQSSAPPLPGPPLRQTISIIEGQLSIDLITFNAA